MLNILTVDLRHALRIFRRSPGFAATAVVSLAVGIAAATGLFSIVNAALLNPFPFTGLALSVVLGEVVAQWSIGTLDDPVVLVAVSLVLFVVTMLSAAIPANRAASIQPADALRID